MCQNATKTAASLMTAIEPTLVQLLTLEGVATTTAGVAAINAFNAADQALAAWVPGTTSQTIIQLIDAFTTVFATLPLPPADAELADLISAGIVTVIGVISANSPAPAAPAGVATASVEETQAQHQVEVIHETTAKVNALVPGFKRSIFTSPAHQYKNEWNKTVEHLGGKYGTLKQ